VAETGTPLRRDVRGAGAVWMTGPAQGMRELLAAGRGEKTSTWVSQSNVKIGAAVVAVPLTRMSAVKR
jgi:hypothetical protein